MPINISKDGSGYKIEPKNTSVVAGTNVSFSVGVQGGVRVCFSDSNIWDPPASFFDLPQGNTSKKTSATAQCTGLGATDSGSNCPAVSGCVTGDAPATISTSSTGGRSSTTEARSEHGYDAPHHKPHHNET